MAKTMKCTCNEGRVTLNKKVQYDVPCKACDGVGHMVYDCKFCEGTGTFVTKSNKEIECNKCNGTGKFVPKDKSCTKCHGKGTIEIYRIEPFETTCKKCRGTGVLYVNLPVSDKSISAMEALRASLPAKKYLPKKEEKTMLPEPPAEVILLPEVIEQYQE